MTREADLSVSEQLRTPNSKKETKKEQHTCQQTALMGLFSSACRPSICADGVRGRFQREGRFSTFVTEFSP